MKNLIVTRHAKSNWNTDASSDFQRPLNKRGIGDAPMMAARLVERGPLPQLILTSTARRALETTELMLKDAALTEIQMLTTDSIYEAPLAALKSAIAKLPDEINTAMMVGHNPGVSTLCSYLCKAALMQMPTCAMACLKLDVDAWDEIYPDCASLHWYDYPKSEQGKSQ